MDPRRAASYQGASSDAPTGRVARPLTLCDLKAGCPVLRVLCEGRGMSIHHRPQGAPRTTIRNARRSNPLLWPGALEPALSEVEGFATRFWALNWAE